MQPAVDRSSLRELAEWRPEGGVLSVYVAIDHADRGEGWRIELREALHDVEPQLAQRVLRRFPDGAAPPDGRSQIGFLEAREKGREVWYESQMEVGETRVMRAAGPCLAPLMRIVDEGWPLGVVAVALERVRVFEWALGRLEELGGWELETTALDWQERKAPRRNPQSDGTGTSSSGREQHMQRMEHNRERFLKEAGHLIATEYGDRDWRRILVFGEGDRPRLLARGLGERERLVHEVRADVIRAGAADIGARVAAELDNLNREREEELVRRVEEAVGTEHAALGPDDVLRALEEGRVHHLVFDAERDLGSHDGTSLSERLIELALTTSADVTPVEGFAAQAVQARGGVVALLRY